jgi:hypothetical protein
MLKRPGWLRSRNPKNLLRRSSSVDDTVIMRDL